jgi:hypothetical protein
MDRLLRIEYLVFTISSIEAPLVKLLCNKNRQFLKRNKQLRCKLEEIKKRMLNI